MSGSSEPIELTAGKVKFFPPENYYNLKYISNNVGTFSSLKKFFQMLHF